MKSKNCLACSKKITNIHPKANNLKYHLTCRKKKDYLTYRKPYAEKQRDLKASKPSKNKFQCIICSKWYKAPVHHAWQRHKIYEREYKEIAGLDHKKGILPDYLKEIKKEHVFQNGTVKNLKKGKKTRFKPNDPRAGKYVRSPQTLERLRQLGHSKLKK